MIKKGNLIVEYYVNEEDDDDVDYEERFKLSNLYNKNYNYLFTYVEDLVRIFIYN
jgi:hypothetical protein